MLETVQNIPQHPYVSLGLHFRKIVGSLFMSRISWPHLINVYMIHSKNSKEGRVLSSGVG